MAITSQTYNGDGSTTAFTFTVPYIDTSDVKAEIGGVATTAFSVSGTTVTFNTAPASGTSNIKIFRLTNNDTIKANFQSGSALRAQDFNDNFLQFQYVTQESKSVADEALTDSTTALTNANSAVTTANNAATDAANAVTTANAASTAATNAVNTANTADTNASAAVTTANTADTNASTALSTANTALSTSNSATTTANTALSTANSATTTANTADTNASSAVTTANSASAAAAAATAAITSAGFYTPVATVSAIPGSPSNQDRIEIVDSTGIESYQTLSGLPGGFVGSSSLTVRLQYNSTTSLWEWQQYFASDPENQYYSKTAGQSNASNIVTKMPLAGGTFTGSVSFDDTVIIKGDSNTSSSGKLTLNCEQNSHGVHIKGPPHSAAASYTYTLPNNMGSSGQFLQTDGSSVTSFATPPDATQSTSGYLSASDKIKIDQGNFTNKADLVNGVIPSSQIPSIAVTEYLGSVSSQSAMLALSGQKGDWAIRTDTDSTFVITGTNPSVISDWTELATPNAVTSVNGNTGAVTLSYSDVGAPSTTGTNASGSWGINITGNSATSTTATNADTVDNLHAASFLRSDTSDTATGALTFNGNVTINGRTNIRGHLDLTDGQIAYFGSSDDVSLYYNGSNNYFYFNNTGVGYIFQGSGTDYFAIESNVFRPLTTTGRLGSSTNKWANAYIDELNIYDDINLFSTYSQMNLADNKQITFGSSADFKFYNNGVNQYMDMMSGTTSILMRDGSIGADRFTFTKSTGNFTASGNVTAYSDITLKKNIELIPNALDKVLSLRGVTYNRTDIENEPKQSGVIAQEVEKVLPEVVSTNEEGIKSVAYGNMVGLLIEAIKELKDEIETLKKKKN